MEEYIKFEFKDGKSKFNFNVSSHDQMLNALVTLEAYCAATFKVPISELRLELDEIRSGLTIKDDNGDKTEMSEIK